MWGGELKPTTGEAAALLRDFSDRVLCLFALYNEIRLAAGAGATLAQQLTERATAVFAASKVSGLVSKRLANRRRQGSKLVSVCL